MLFYNFSNFVIFINNLILMIYNIILLFNSRLNLDLCLAMVKHNVDLIVIEGMGRTLHTNFHAKMKCDCLKLAVVKNRWLALRLGGDMYAVICKYEQSSKTKIYDIGIKSKTIEDDCPSMYRTDNGNIEMR